ncbi:MAG: hypothetical protein KA521_05405 [Crocinitomicaceae bacterium]|nr:hypothetical protein [Crocinitomicaceae bacterium]
MESFEQLLDQIDGFIRKYYKNQLLRGTLLFISVFLFSFLFTTVFEFTLRLNTYIRAFLFFGFIFLNCFIFYRFFLVPLLKLASFGKRISRDQAAEIIGNFFPEISDRLKNTLQLQKDLQQNRGNIELLKASVQQRSTNLKLIPFQSAIRLNENKRFLKYIVPLFLLFVVIGIAAPRVYKESVERVVHFTKIYKEKAPFIFVLPSTNYTIEEGKNLTLEVLLVGSVVPESVYLSSENGKFLMKKSGRNKFISTIKKVKATSYFHFEANDFSSENYKITVFGKATIGKLQASLIYPEYLKKQNEVIQNAGDLTLPEGTQIQWSVLSKNSKYVDFITSSTSKRFYSKGFKFSQKYFNSSIIKLNYANLYYPKIDSSVFKLTIVKDAFPSIQLSQLQDSLSNGLHYFKGVVGDDYGLTHLKFVYTIVSENGETRTNQLPVQVVTGTEATFDFAVDFRRESVQLNDRIDYYFEVEDNDGVNGHKKSRSTIYTYKLPSLDELNEKREEDQSQIKSNLNDLLKRSKDFQKNLQKLKKETLNAKTSDWNKLNKLNQLKEEQKNIVESLEKLQNKIDKSSQEKNQLSEIDIELLQKQEQIEKLLEELMDDELKKLLDDLQKLLQENNKDDLKEKLDKLEESSDKMKNQLDRSLEMLKKLQLNEKIDAIEKELKELAKEQKDLQKETTKGDVSNDKLEDKQQTIKDRFDQVKEDLKEMDKLNEELSEKLDVKSPEELKKEVDQNLQEASEQLQKNKKTKAAEKQNKAAEEMEQMAESLNQQQEEANKEEEEEDINTLRGILENLLSSSLSQEYLLVKFPKINTYDPLYKRLGRKQRSIVDNTKMIKDSLLALAKRQPKIASFVDKELQALQSNHKLALEDLDEHDLRKLNLHQQLAMTSFNNLALLLNESLQSMQQQMQMKMDGNGSCSKPGKGKSKPKPGGSSPGDMKQMLKKQLDQLKKGSNPGGKQPGDKDGQGSKPGGNSGSNPFGLSNKETAKMAAEQTALRRKLDELKNQLNKEGKGKGNQLNPLINELEKQEKDLINRNFSNDLIERQKNIITRLLESEKALMERGFEEKRESKAGNNSINGNQIRFDEYNKQKLKQIELLYTVDPVFKKYYMDKANQYFNSNF